MMRDTEFGRGYATCLFQFVNHAPRLEQDLKIYGEMAAKVDSGRLFTPEQAVMIWANGAADHLRDLITGGRVPARERKAARIISGEAWEAGHGYKREFSPDQARTWIATAKSLLVLAGDPKTLEEAVVVDLRLGLRPELGITCSTPMSLR